MGVHIFSSYDGEPNISTFSERKVEEDWSDAARAASAAARRGRGEGFIPRQISALKAFVAAGGKRGKKLAKRRSRKNSAYDSKLWKHYQSLSDPSAY